MKNTVRVRPLLLHLLLLSAFMFISGCLLTADSARTSGRTCVLAPDFAEGGRLSIFLRLQRPDVPRLWLKIAAVEVLDGETWIPLSGGAIEIDTGKLGRGQMLLGRRKIPVGTCKAIRFDLAKAALVKKDGSRVRLMLEDSMPRIDLPTPMALGLDASESLFLSLDVDATLRGTVFARPVISVATSQSMPLISDLAYVSCPEIDTVYLFRTDRNWVHGSIGIKGRPQQLLLDPASSRLYVLASAASKVLVIDLKTNRVLDRISLAMVQEPSFMAADADVANAFLIDSRGNYLARYDLASGNLAVRARIGQRMDFVTYLPAQERLAVSSALDQSVYLVNPDDLAVQQQIGLSGVPAGMAVDGNILYIAEESADTVAAYDLETRQMLRRVRVGSRPYRVMVHNGEVFVSNRGGGGVSIFRSGQVYASRSLRGTVTPTELDVSGRNHWLYVADDNCGGIRVFDATSKLPAGLVDLQTEPADIAVLN